MNRLLLGTMLPLFAAGFVAACGTKDDNSGANAALASNAATPAAAPGDCNPGKGIRVGDTVAVNLAGNLAGTLPPKQLRWDTAGDFVTLAATGAAGSGKEVELIASTGGGGSSPAVGECLRSGSYFRMASTKHAAPDRYLQAYQGTDANHVTIGNYPDPQANSTFFVLKVSGAPGTVIERGDEVTIRGTQHDPWLFAPDDAAAGTAVGLVHHPEQDDPKPDVAKWTFGNKGDGN
jgi:hypothetical protein